MFYVSIKRSKAMLPFHDLETLVIWRKWLYCVGLELSAAWKAFTYSLFARIESGAEHVVTSMPKFHSQISTSNIIAGRVLKRAHSALT